MARAVRQTKVASIEQLSKNMKRITVTGESLMTFPDGFDGGYVKVMVPESLDDTVARSFTVRGFDTKNFNLTLDMVAHGDHGPAARWASNVSIGDLVNIQGPGACKRLNHDADWFLLAGDMTALPAISVNLELLPKDAKGYAVLEVISEEDRIELNAPDGVEVIWVINPNPTALNSELSDTFTELPWMQGQVSAWVAGEFNTSRVLRRYIRHERKVERDFTYISCYWKIGETDEGMKAAKRNDKEPW